MNFEEVLIFSEYFQVIEEAYYADGKGGGGVRQRIHNDESILRPSKSVQQFSKNPSLKIFKKSPNSSKTLLKAFQASLKILENKTLWGLQKFVKINLCLRVLKESPKNQLEKNNLK